MIYYFKRIFNSVNNSKSYLQLYKCTLGDYTESVVKNKAGNEYIFHEDTMTPESDDLPLHRRSSKL